MTTEREHELLRTIAAQDQIIARLRHQVGTQRDTILDLAGIGDPEANRNVLIDMMHRAARGFGRE